MMADTPTICVKCKHHRYAEGRHAGAKNDAWCDHLCSNPKYEHPKKIDPVTGKMKYVGGNKEPYCYEKNDGTCKGFVRCGWL